MRNLRKSLIALCAMACMAFSFSVTAQADVYQQSVPVFDQLFQGEMDGLDKAVAVPNDFEGLDVAIDVDSKSTDVARRTMGLAVTPIEPSTRPYLAHVVHGTKKVTDASSWPNGDGYRPNNDGRTTPS